MKLVAGSYERFLWGWQVEENVPQLKSLLSYPAHMGPIKCIAALGRVVVTGGSDDTVRVFDIAAKKDVATLLAHKGAITSLSLFKGVGIDRPTHLFSGSEDGTICIWDADSWVHLKTMKGKAAVNDFSVHPSGRMGLSVERDGNLRMWNLVKGRCTFSTKLRGEGSIINFFPDAGEQYMVVRKHVVDICNAADGNSVYTLAHDKPVLALSACKDKVLFAGGEDCNITAWDMQSGKHIFVIASAHSSRIKGLVTWDSDCNGSFGGSHILASASSDGFVRVWDTRMVGNNEGQSSVLSSGTKARLTCLSCVGNTSSQNFIPTEEIEVGGHVNEESTGTKQVKDKKVGVLKSDAKTGSSGKSKMLKRRAAGLGVKSHVKHKKDRKEKVNKFTSSENGLETA